MKGRIALGTFDGVHIGHRLVLSTAAQGEESVALTFRMPPKAYSVRAGLLLTDEDQKKEEILSLGIGRVDFLDFPTVKDLSAQAFFAFLQKEYDPQALVCGENYTFGHGATGTVDLLKTLCGQNGIQLMVCPGVTADGVTVSSSRIRDLLSKGQIEQANRLLFHPFSFLGTVVHGDARGRTIGFPTLNLLYPKEMTPVPYGVYDCEVLLDGQRYRGIGNIGVRPTFENKFIGCEIHLFDYSGDAYGKSVRVSLLRFLRPEQKFEDVESLIQAIQKDCAQVLGKGSKSV